MFWLKQDGGISSALLRAENIPCLDEEERGKLIFARSCFEQLNSKLNQLSISQLLREITALTGYEEVLLAGFNGRQSAANLHKLFSLVERLEARGTFSLREFVHYLELLASRDEREGEAEIVEEGENAVRLMTVHAAKGLEFPVVFIPDLIRKAKSETRLFLYDEYLGLGIKVANEAGSLKPGSLYQGLKLLSDEMERAEHKRIFYVALTRAQDYLVLGISDSKPLKLPRELKGVCSLEEAEEQLLNSSQDWLSWLKIILGYVEEFSDEITENTVISCGEETKILVNPSLADENRGSYASKKQPDFELKFELDEKLLNPLPPAANEDEFYFSPTSLLAYNQCPRKFYYAYCLKLPAAQEESSGDKVSNFLSPIVRGNLVHLFCCLYRDGEDPATVFDECLKQEGIVEQLFSTAKNQCLPLIENYLQSEVYARVRGVSAVNSEWPFIYRGKGYRLQGKIDKLLFTEQGLEIIDFKTDTISSGEVGASAARYKLQLELYWLAVEKILKQTVHSALVHFLVPNCAQSFRLSPSRVAELEDELSMISCKANKNNPEEFRKTGVGCRYCGYVLLCNS